jgi:hypothetical protein
MSLLDTIITELLQQLAGTNIAEQGDAIVNTLVQLLSLIGLRTQARDLQSEHLYFAALAGSVTAAQQLYHNAQADSGMPVEDIKDAQSLWPKLQAAGWTVNGTGLAGVVSPPAVK